MTNQDIAEIMKLVFNMLIQMTLLVEIYSMEFLFNSNCIISFSLFVV